MKRYFVTIILITFAFLSVSAIAEDSWQTIRHFEQVSTFKLKRVRYEPPLVFEWGNPVDLSGNNDLLPAWHALLRTSSDWSDMTLEHLRSLYTSSSWTSVAIDDLKFDAIKKKKAQVSELYPEMRYELIYAETHLRIDERIFMFLSKAHGKNIQEARNVIKNRMMRTSECHSASFLEKVDGKWKHHRLSLEIEKMPILQKIPLSVVRLGEIIKSGKSYFDVNINPVNMMPLEVVEFDEELGSRRLP